MVCPVVMVNQVHLDHLVVLSKPTAPVRQTSKAKKDKKVNQACEVSKAMTDLQVHLASVASTAKTVNQVKQERKACRANKEIQETWLDSLSPSTGILNDSE